MKFCKNLQRVVDISDPEWAPYWTNYKMLKVSGDYQSLQDQKHCNHGCRELLLELDAFGSVGRRLVTSFDPNVEPSFVSSGSNFIIRNVYCSVFVTCIFLVPTNLQQLNGNLSVDESPP
jgi:hypothetical protein